MITELKKVIINYIIENEKDFQLTNNTINNFRNYIYDGNGNYLIGGEDVSNFIREAINLITKN